MNSNNYAVIMAGGEGTRFWPYSRNKHPKQFLDVLGAGSSLLQMTYERFLGICQKENIFVVTNESYAKLVSKQLPDLTKEQLLLEPVRRNTAPCVAYACHKIALKNPEATIVVSPADHAIFKDSLFDEAINIAFDEARSQDKLITIGITPNRPEVAYGYIQFHEGPETVKKVKTFTEKPQKDMAQKFIESGDFVWNAGIFIWNAQSIKKAFERHLPEVSEIFQEASQYFDTEEETLAIKKAYAQCKVNSIDRSILEKAENVYVVLGSFGWSDLGSWNSLHEFSRKDNDNNLIDANTLVYNSSDCIIKGPEDKLIVAQGLQGYLVAVCDNTVLICEKSNERRFREFVADVKKMKGEDYL